MPGSSKFADSKRRLVMKSRLTGVVFILALAAFSWAQTPTSKSNPTQPSTAVPAATKADDSCCQKMADGKAAESCCAHQPDGSAKSEMSCCKGKGGKDAMSCMKGDKDKSTDASCSNGKCGDGDGKAGCCPKSDKTTEQAAMACCGADGAHCGMAHHDHAEISK
jgi:hypothetical protein